MHTGLTLNSLRLACPVLQNTGLLCIALAVLELTL
uniref:Uncharacterized protein n=1 Tax=Trichinella nativa TaxID=6335 RepID=A0A0V1KIB0_9BILA